MWTILAFRNENELLVVVVIKHGYWECFTLGSPKGSDAKIYGADLTTNLNLLCLVSE